MLERPITFFFRGGQQQVENIVPTMTVLQFLREYTQTGKTRETGTKEGCAEGDCGACTVVIGELVNDNLQLRSVNACIQFLPTLDGKALFTVEDLHSLLPVPDGKVLGLSKFARITEMFARRLQIQENLTQQIAEAVAEVTGARGVAVVIDSAHMCMMMRGVGKQESTTRTVSFVGDFKTDKEARREFLSAVPESY